MTLSFPDVEKLMCDLVVEAGWVPNSDHTGTHAPAKLLGLVPFCRINRYGGGDDSVTDQPSLDIDWFGSDRSIRQIAANAHDWLTLGRLHTSGLLIDVVRTITGITERPWDADNIRCFGGSYQFEIRRSIH